MTLTKRQLRAAARHARDLAMECVNETAPELGRWFEAPTCAMGRLSLRIGNREASALAWAICGLYLDGEPLSIVYDANDYAQSQRERLLRLPFPLMFLADALENAAQPPSEDLP